MNKRIERLHFRADLFWSLKYKTFEQLFEDSNFIVKFNRFLDSEEGKDWLISEDGTKYAKWLEE